MRPKGQYPVKFPSKTDAKPRRKYGEVNWWECENGANKAKAKRLERAEIRDEVDELKGMGEQTAHD